MARIIIRLMFLLLLVVLLPPPSKAQSSVNQWVEHVGFNVTTSPFDNVPLRQAIASAIDRQAIFEAVRQRIPQIRGAVGIGPAGSWFPPMLPQYIPGKIIHPTDIAAAKSLLAKAGFPDGKDLPEIEFLYRSDNPWRALVGETVKTQLAAIGVRIKLVGLSGTAFFGRVIPGPGRVGQFQMAIFAWGTSDPKDDFLGINFVQGGPQNGYGYRNPDVTVLIADIQKEKDEAKRLAMLRDAEKLILTDAPVVPLFYWSSPR